MFELVVVKDLLRRPCVLSHRISSTFAFEVRVVVFELDSRLRVVVLVVVVVVWLVRLIPGETNSIQPRPFVSRSIPSEWPRTRRYTQVPFHHQS